MPKKPGPPMHVSPAMLKRHIQRLLDASYIYKDVYLPIQVTERYDGTYLVMITRSRIRVDPQHLASYLASTAYGETDQDPLGNLFFLCFSLKKQTVEAFLSFETFPMPPVIESVLARRQAKEEKKREQPQQPDNRPSGPYTAG